ncbi:peptide transporter family 1-like [Ctenocephalides felis]|uniref:peptide transporter family 1-like n=1 Tax=Ctenocephalides felis TaxID=7515 RepID=UPI000E6E1093|nr:peptide transporter family 1-like [Ctenocephalides felis]
MEEQQTSSKIPKGIYPFFFIGVFWGMYYASNNAITRMFMVNKIGFTKAETTSYFRYRRIGTYLLYPFGALVTESYGNKYYILGYGFFRGIIAQSLFILEALPSLRSVAKGIVYFELVYHLINSFILSRTQFVFEGDQFKLPEQRAALMKYFRINYIIQNFASLVGHFISPLAKTKVPCLGEQDCFILPFGIGMICVILCLIIYLAGTPLYTINRTTRKTAQNIVRCIWYGLKKSIRERKTNPQAHWLDHAEPKFGTELVVDIKTVLNMLVIFCCIPLYSGVYFMGQDEWIFQASRMDGQFGSYTFIVEHFELLNPLLAVILMPICQYVIDPLIKPCKLDRTFRRMIFGGLMVALAFWISAFLESCIKINLPVLPQSNEFQIRIFNELNCIAVIEAPSITSKPIVMGVQEKYTNKHIPSKPFQIFPLIVKGTCFSQISEMIEANGGTAVSILLKIEDGNAVAISYNEILEKSEAGQPILSVIGAKIEDSVIARDSKGVDVAMTVTPTLVAGDLVVIDTKRTVEVVVEEYNLILNEASVLNFHLYQGGVYLITISGTKANLFVITEPNSVHISWMLPQSILLIFGEIYFSLTFFEFIYSEAPPSCKILVASLQFFADGIGQYFVQETLRIQGMDLDHKLYMEATLLALSMVLLMIVAKRFKPLITKQILF